MCNLFVFDFSFGVALWCQTFTFASWLETSLHCIYLLSFLKVNKHWVECKLTSDTNCNTIVPSQKSTIIELQSAWRATSCITIVLSKDQQALSCNQRNGPFAKINKHFVAISTSSSDVSWRETSCITIVPWQRLTSSELQSTCPHQMPVSEQQAACITFVPLHGLTSSEFRISLSLSDAGSCCHTQKLALLASLLAQASVNVANSFFKI